MKLPLCAALLGGLAASLSAVGEPPAKAGKTAAAKAAAAKKLLTQHRCQLRMMWWVSPAENVELGVQQDDEVVSVGLAQMQVNGTLDYHGEPLVQIMKKTDTGVLDKKGKPVIAWTPYATIPLRPEDTDICAILFDDGKGGARTKLFDFRPTVFPYGSLQVVNLSKKPLTCGLDSRTMTIAPGRNVISPNSFIERAAPQINLSTVDANGESVMLFASRMIMSSFCRSLFFVVERPAEDGETRIEVTSIVDMNPNPVGVIKSAVPAPAPTPPPTGKPAGVSPAPRPNGA
jgi:hypothetical protein